MTSTLRLPLAFAALLHANITCSDHDYKRLHFSGSTVNGSGEQVPVDMEYLLYTRGGKTEGLPLIVFLHGAGGHENLLGDSPHWPWPALDKMGTKNPFVMVRPICATCQDAVWRPDELKELIAYLQDSLRTDPERLYLTGVSMGGFGAWALARNYPDLFAAVVPVCGGGRASKAWKMMRVPVWAFHGREDDVVPYYQTKNMVEALRAADGNARLTTYPDAGHDIWDLVYQDPEVVTWLFAQRRGTRDPVPASAEASYGYLAGLDIHADSLYIWDDSPAERVITFTFTNTTPSPCTVAGTIAGGEGLTVNEPGFSLDIPAQTHDTLQRTISLPAARNEAAPLRLQYAIAYAAKDHGQIAFEADKQLCITPGFRCRPTVGPKTIDGSTDDWAAAFIAGTPGNGAAVHGFSFATVYDETYLYVAVRVQDPAIAITPGRPPWEHDGVEIRLDARPAEKRMNRRALEEYTDILLIPVSAGTSPSGKPEVFWRDRLPEGTRCAVHVADTTYTVEAAIPMSYFAAMGNENWTSFRLNMAVNNCDSPGSNRRQLWWQPDWRQGGCALGSGTFFRAIPAPHARHR